MLHKCANFRQKQQRHFCEKIHHASFFLFTSTLLAVATHAFKINLARH